MPRGRKITKPMELEEQTLQSASDEFYKHNRIKGLAMDTQKAYQIYVGCFVKWCGEDTLLSEITTKLLEDYICKKADDGNKTVSIATNMVHLRRFFRFCHARGYMEKIDVTIPKYEKTLKEPYTDEEMKLLLKKPTSNNWVEYRSYVMVNYFYSTGQRLSTVLNIKVSHLDLEHARVKLIWNKDKIQKWMPLSPALLKILKEYIYISELQDDDFLFPEYEGGKLKKRSAEDAIIKYNKSRGVTKTSIHLFRHTFAKSYIINGGNPAKLQKLMNHKTIEQTMKYVNLYSNEIYDDIGLFNPLDVLKKKSPSSTRRKSILLEAY